MRAFFKDILLNLYIYCGNRQADKMTVEEVDTLLTALERMSKIYSYIPEEKQKEIILTCLVSDREYQNINVRTVSKWLEQNGKVFFQQECHVPTEQTAQPLTGEERERWLKKWEKALGETVDQFAERTIKGNGAKMREQLDEAGVKFDEEKHKEKYLSHPVKSFVIEGLEIFAESEEQAKEIYKQNFGEIVEREADKT